VGIEYKSEKTAKRVERRTRNTALAMGTLKVRPPAIGAWKEQPHARKKGPAKKNVG